MTRFKDRKDFEEKLVKAFLNDIERLEKTRKPGMLFWGQGGPAFQGGATRIPADTRTPEEKQKEMDARAAEAAKEKQIREEGIANFNAQVRAEREVKERRAQERQRMEDLRSKHQTKDWRVAPEVHRRHQELKQHLMKEMPEEAAHAEANRIISEHTNASQLGIELSRILGKN